MNITLTTGKDGAGYGGTSTTSLSIGTGSKTLTTQRGRAYVVGSRIRIASAAAPTSKWMEGVVTSYSGTSLVFTSDASAGSGTAADWTISIAGEPGEPTLASQAEAESGTENTKTMTALRTAQAIRTGKTLWVDATHGNDSNAGGFTKPFLTIAAAKAAASSGDLIHVRPGSYTETATTSKAGVNLHLAAGATLTKNANDGIGPIGDGSALSNSAMTVNVSGDGSFVTTDSVGEYSGPVVVNHASSIFTVAARKLTANHTSGSAGFPTAITAAAGTCRVRVSESITATSSVASAYGIWWQNGICEITAPEIIGSSAAIYSQVDNTPTGDLYVTADNIYSTGLGSYRSGGVILDNGSEPTAAAWITAKTVRSPGTDVGSVYHQGGGRVYITAQKMFGAIASLGTGLLYVTTQKLSAVANGGGTVNILAGLIYAYGGTIYLKCDHYDPVTYTGAMFDIGCTAFIDGGSYVANSGSGGLVVTGDVTIVGMTIDTSANSSADAVTVTSGTLRLINCRLISHASKKDINQSGGTVTVIGGSGSGTDGALTTTGTVGHVANASSLALRGSTSGIASIVARAVAGSPTLKTPMQGGTLTAREYLTADFATTADAGSGETWHAGFAVTSGKTYYVHARGWLKWATAVTSGAALVHLNGDEVTFSSGRVVLESNSTAATEDLPDSLSLSVVEFTGGTRFELRGLVTMSATGTLRPKITCYGWDASDVVTVMKGSFFEVSQID